VPGRIEKAHRGLRARLCGRRINKQCASATEVCPHLREDPAPVTPDIRDSRHNDIRGLQDLPLPQGDGSLPLIGGTLEFFANQDDFVSNRVRKFGPIVGTSLIGRKAVLVAGRGLLEQIMVKEPGLLVQGFGTDFVQLLGPSSLLHLDGERHMGLKRLLIPSLAKRCLKNYIPRIVEIAEKALEEWVDKECIVFVEEAHLLFSTFIAEAVLGMKFPMGPWSRKDVCAALETLGHGLLSFGINLPFTRFGKAMAARESLLGMIRMAIQRFEQNPDDQSALHALINARDEYGNGLNACELEDTILTLIYAGIDSSSLVLSVAVQNIAKHPEVWKKLQKEQDEIIAKHGTEMSQEAVEEMAYAKAVWRESARLLAIPAAFRVATRDFELGGHRIPKGWTVIVATGGTAHYFDEGWNVDEEFRPERLLPDTDFHAVHDLSFGLGGHMCPGMQLSILEGKIMLATFARGYNFKLAKMEARLTYDPFPFPEGRQALLVTRRK